MDSTPNSAESHDRQSAEQGADQLPEPFTGCKTFGEMFRRLEEGACERTRGYLPPDIHEKIWRHMFRYFDPWPDWVLRIAAEVLHVQLPTISKPAIQDALRFVHFIMLEARFDGSNKAAMPKLPELNPSIMGALVGHGLAYSHHIRKRIEELKDVVPAERLEEISNQASLDKFHKKVVPAIGKYLQQKPESFVEFQAGYGHAERNTFDKHGSRKETPLTPIYEKILSDWPEIECLSGPKALTEYLSPLLGNQDFEDKYERVKAICKRMRITFKPFVKGRRSSAPPSLHRS